MRSFSLILAGLFIAISIIVLNVKSVDKVAKTDYINIIDNRFVKYPITKWDHGYKTNRVIATRYSNPSFQYNIGFKFPLNENDSDRIELTRFMLKHNGSPFQSGGHFGSEMLVVFEDVENKESANKKIIEIIPALSQLMEDIGEGKAKEFANPPKL